MTPTFLFPLLLLLIGINAENTVTITCAPCGSQICLTYSGGGFNGQAYPSSQASTCAQAGNFPLTYDFLCATSCTDCVVQFSDSTQSDTFCSETQTGQILINAFDLLYSVEQGDTSFSTTYNWCGCSGGLSTGAIIGIIIGCLLGVALIGGLIYYCVFVKRKNNKELDSSLVVNTQPVYGEKAETPVEVPMETIDNKDI